MLIKRIFPPFVVQLVLLIAIIACTPQGENNSTAALPPESVSTLVLTVEESPQSTVATHPFADNPAWIAFQRRDENGVVGVWLVHPDGSGEHQILTDTRVEVRYASWSPDGFQIAVAPLADQPEPIYVYDLAADTSRPLFTCEDPCIGDDEPIFSPDGEKVAFIRYLGPFRYWEEYGFAAPADCGLWIGDLATSEVIQITSNTAPPCDREYLPRWSPDGSKFVYTRDPYENGKPTGTAVYVINADGTGEYRLTDPDMNAGEADWSPDGRWVVFATYPLFEYEDSPGPSNLYRMRPDGSGIEPLTFNETSAIRSTTPVYTPDGQWILYTEVTTEGRNLRVIPAEGGEPVLIAAGEPGRNYTAGSWQPQSAE